jgi:hypothetical protein
VTASRVHPRLPDCITLRAGAKTVLTRKDGRSVADDGAMGPISYLIVEFPGNKMTGEGLPILVDLVDLVDLV